MSSKSNASSTSFAEMIENVIDYKKLDVIDYLRSVALLAAFLVMVFKSPASGRGSFFAIGDVLGTGMCGLACYFFPVSYMSHKIDGNVDIYHQYILQVIGAVLLGTTWTRYRSLNTRDAYCSMSLLISRFLGGMIMLMIMLNNYYGVKGSTKFREQHFTFGIFGCFLWVAAHAIQLWQYSGEGKRAYGSLGSNRRDSYLFMAGILVITNAMFSLGFAEASFKFAFGTAKGPDGIHLYLLQVYAILAFMIGLHVLASMTFETDEDKKNVFGGALVVHGLVYPLMFLYQLKHGIYTNFCLILGFMLAATFTFLLGFCDGEGCSWCSPVFNLFKGNSKRKSK